MIIIPKSPKNVPANNSHLKVRNITERIRKRPARRRATIIVVCILDTRWRQRRSLRQGQGSGMDGSPNCKRSARRCDCTDSTAVHEIQCSGNKSPAHAQLGNTSQNWSGQNRTSRTACYGHEYDSYIACYISHPQSYCPLPFIPIAILPATFHTYLGYSTNTPRKFPLFSHATRIQYSSLTCIGFIHVLKCLQDRIWIIQLITNTC